MPHFHIVALRLQNQCHAAISREVGAEVPGCLVLSPGQRGAPRHAELRPQERHGRRLPAAGGRGVQGECWGMAEVARQARAITHGQSGGRAGSAVRPRLRVPGWVVFFSASSP